MLLDSSLIVTYQSNSTRKPRTRYDEAIRAEEPRIPDLIEGNVKDCSSITVCNTIPQLGVYNTITTLAVMYPITSPSTFSTASIFKKPSPKNKAVW